MIGYFPRDVVHTGVTERDLTRSIHDGRWRAEGLGRRDLHGVGEWHTHDVVFAGMYGR